MNQGFRSAIVLACALLFANPGPASSAEAVTGQVRLTGSSTLAPLIRDLAKRFQELHPQVKISVESGGSGRGIADALAGKADIGMVSRALKGDEKKDLFAITIARDGVAFVVHRDNPVRAVTRAQLIDLYSGHLTNWKALGGNDAPIQVVSRTHGRGSLEVVSTYFDLNPEAIKAQRVAGENVEAVQSVLDNRNALVFNSIGFTLESIHRGKPLMMLTVDGVPATAANLRAGLYPVSRELNLVTKTVPKGAAFAFIEFVASKAAHALIEEHDFVPYLN